MIGRCSALGNDFQASAARAREASGVWVVVDLYFLDGGGSNAGPIRFDAVHDERDAVGSSSVVVEEAGHGCNVGLIKDGDAVERVAVDGAGVLVFGTLGADEGCGISGGDGDGFVGNRDLQDDANGGLTSGGPAYVDASVTETLGVKVEHVVAGYDVVEAERARIVRGHFSELFVAGGEERHVRLGDSRARGVEERSGNGTRRRRERLVFREIRCSGTRGPAETLGKEYGW